MISQKFLEKVTTLAADFQVSEEAMLKDGLLAWVNEFVGPTGFETRWNWDFKEIPLEVPGKWETDETNDTIVRFGIMSFADFWARYEYPAGSKKKAREKFARITKKELRCIDQTLHIYKAETYTSVEVRGKKQRKYPEFYLSRTAKIWETVAERYDAFTGSVEQRNLDGIFESLNVEVGYMIAPDKEALQASLTYFDRLVGGYSERHLRGALQEFYDDKGKYAGKIANILRSQDFLKYYTSRC